MGLELKSGNNGRRIDKILLIFKASNARNMNDRTRKVGINILPCIKMHTGNRRFE